MSPRVPLRRVAARLLRAAPVLMLTLVLSLLLDGNGDVERAALDARARLAPPREEPRVVVVRIDQADFDTLFQGRSPLDPARVREIVEAIGLGEPLAIGVDLESADPAYASIPDRVGKVPVVWARDARCRTVHGAPVDACPPERLDPGPARGRAGPFPQTGLALLSPDEDGTLRRYRRSFATAEGTQVTFASAVLRSLGMLEDTSRVERLIDYRPARAAPITASWVLAHADTGEFRRRGVLKDKVVLLGGAYPATRDWHATPLGLMAGVDVWAQVLETERERSGIVPPTPVRIGLVQFLAGLGLVLLFQFLSLERAVLLSVVAIPLTSVAVGWLAFGSGHFWIYFLPLLTVLLVQQLYDLAKQYRDELLTGPYPGPAAGDSARDRWSEWWTERKIRLPWVARPRQPANAGEDVTAAPGPDRKGGENSTGAPATGVQPGVSGGAGVGTPP